MQNSKCKIVAFSSGEGGPLAVDEESIIEQCKMQNAKLNLVGRGLHKNPAPTKERSEDPCPPTVPMPSPAEKGDRIAVDEESIIEQCKMQNSK